MQTADLAAALRSAGHKDVAQHKVRGRTHMSVWTGMLDGESEETSSWNPALCGRVSPRDAARHFLQIHDGRHIAGHERCTSRLVKRRIASSRGRPGSVPCREGRSRVFRPHRGDASLPAKSERCFPRARLRGMGLAPGTRLGPYEILSPIGAGAMGEVYRARDNRLGRDVAIKVLPGEHGAESGSPAEVRARSARRRGAEPSQHTRAPRHRPGGRHRVTPSWSCSKARHCARDSRPGS